MKEERVEFITGDVVVLKSGSLPMTVCHVGTPDINCVWFDLNNQLQEHAFNSKLLRLYDENLDGPKVQRRSRFI